MKLFGSSGIRAIYDKNLLETTFKVGLAVGKLYCRVVIGRDTRTSGDAMTQAVISGLLASGAEYRDAGIAPTPTIAYITREFDAGIMITASHNPPEYNGLKLLNPDGSSFDTLQQKIVESVFNEKSPASAGSVPANPAAVYQGAIEKHLNAILSDFPGKLNVKVVVDAGGGAASNVTPRLLENLGCQVTAINCTPTGSFPRGSEPNEENLKELSRAVKESGAALGIAHDGDADRMMVIDEQGRYISGDKLMAIFIKAIGAKDVVTTLDATLAVDEWGAKVRRTKIGDTWVSEELKKGGDFGGETAGAWIFPKFSLCPDGIYAAARIASIAAAHKLSALADAVNIYPLRRGSVSSQGVSWPTLEAKMLGLKPKSHSKIDGLKVDLKYGWLLIRPSGTEPKIRVTAEAKTEKSAQEYFDLAMKAIDHSTNIGEKKR
jgi:phosphoglucosamine mutase